MKLFLLAVLVAVAAARCPNDCSNHGSCNVYSECQCFRNWMGADCSERVCYFGHAFVDTPQGDINMDGIVGDGIAISSNIYTVSHNQDDTFKVQWSNAKSWEFFDFDSHMAGNVAATEATYDEAHFYRECSNKGVCNRQTGECSCFPGYEGEGCTRTACPNDCSGHGQCGRLKDQDINYVAWDAAKTQRCACDPGYIGPDCSMRVCPSGDDPITHTQLDEVQIVRFWPGESYTIAVGSDVHKEFALGQEVTLGGTGGSGSGVVTVAAVFASGSTTLTITCTGACAAATGCTITGSGSAATTAGGNALAGSGNANNFHGTWALRFTDEFGDKWTTSALAWPHGNAVQSDSSRCTTNADNSNVGLLDTACAHTSAAELKAALKALPNNAIPDVTVTFEAATDGGDGWQYLVTFTDNPGDLPALEVLYEVTQCLGSTSCGKEAAASNLMRVFSSSGKAWATNGALATGTQQFSSTITNSGTGFGVVAFKAGVFAAGTADGGGGLDEDGVTGTKENRQCSDRGLCDYSTGICKCFNGYTDADCSTQNALSMS